MAKNRKQQCTQVVTASREPDWAITKNIQVISTSIESEWAIKRSTHCGTISKAVKAIKQNTQVGTISKGSDWIINQSTQIERIQSSIERVFADSKLTREVLIESGIYDQNLKLTSSYKR